MWKGNQQKIGIIPLPKDVIGETNLPIAGKLNAGDMVIRGQVKKSDITIDVEEINIDKLLETSNCPLTTLRG